MDTTSPSNAQPPAGDGNRHGWGAGIALGVAGFIMFVLLILPGFLAAGFSRAGPVLRLGRTIYYGRDGEVDWGSDFSSEGLPVYIRAELIILVPSGWLMKHSQSIRQFYSWQYHLAGGLESRYVFTFN